MCFIANNYEGYCRMLQKRFLITGCGGDIAQGICRILKKEGLSSCVVGCDVHDEHLGRCIFDSCEIICTAENPQYFHSIKRLSKKHKIDIILPMSENEIFVFLKNDFIDYFEEIPVILPNKSSIQIGLDKFETIKFLAQNDLNYPWTKIVMEGDPKEIPCILKKRYGQGSKGFVKITDKELVNYYKKIRQDDLWQELLMPEEEEYTCGLYRTKLSEIRSIIFRRVLQGGFTKSGVVVNNQSIYDYLSKIANAIDLSGSINVQLKLTNRGPVAFEINPRFSSTVVFRHILGFQDFVWSLKEKLGISLDQYANVKPGIRIFRGIREYIEK